eukprot:1147329-Pelagomonas_calceolata.AAC.1
MGGRSGGSCFGLHHQGISSSASVQQTFACLDFLSWVTTASLAWPVHVCVTSTAVNEWYRPNCSLEFPMGGSQAMVSALVRGLEKRGGRLLLKSHFSHTCSCRGLEKRGGRLLLNSHVERIISDDNRGASGVVLRGGGTIKATKAVVSKLEDVAPGLLNVRIA